MRPISRMLLSGGVLAACLAPVLRAEITGQQSRSLSNVVRAPGGTVPPANRFPADAGAGAGIWFAPTQDELGFLNAQLYDGTGRHRYTVRANLLDVHMGPRNMDAHGGLLGVLMAVDGQGKKTAVGEVAGKWTRHPDGTADFDVEILAASKVQGEPPAIVGRIQGALLVPGIMPLGTEIEPTPREEIEPEPLPGQVVLRWTIGLD